MYVGDKLVSGKLTTPTTTTMGKIKHRNQGNNNTLTIFYFWSHITAISFCQLSEAVCPDIGQFLSLPVTGNMVFRTQLSSLCPIILDKAASVWTWKCVSRKQNY